MANDTSINLPYIVLTGTVITVGLIALLIVRPMLSEIQKTKDSIAQEGAHLAARQQFLETIDRKLAELNAQGQQEQNLSVILPTSDRTEDALRILHRSAEATGLLIRSVADDSEGALGRLNASRARGEAVGIPTDVTPLAFNIEFSGSYQQFRAFIKELERSPRLMDVTSTTLQASNDGSGTIGGKLAIRFYMQNPATTTTK